MCFVNGGIVPDNGYRLPSDCSWSVNFVEQRSFGPVEQHSFGPRINISFSPRDPIAVGNEIARLLNRAHDARR